MVDVAKPPSSLLMSRITGRTGTAVCYVNAAAQQRKSGVDLSQAFQSHFAEGVCCAPKPGTDLCDLDALAHGGQTQTHSPLSDKQESPPTGGAEPVMGESGMGGGGSRTPGRHPAAPQRSDREDHHPLGPYISGPGPDSGRGAAPAGRVGYSDQVACF